MRARPGRVRLGCLIPMLLLGAGGYVAIIAGEVYLRFYEYRDAMDTEARFAMRTSNEEIIAHLRARADSLDLPEEARDVHVSRGHNAISIWASYTDSLRFPGYAREVTLQPYVQRTF